MEGEEFIGFLKLMLRLNPSERIMPREAINHSCLTIAAREKAQAGFCAKPAANSDATREANRRRQRNYWLKQQIVAEMERKWLAKENNRKRQMKSRMKKKKLKSEVKRGGGAQQGVSSSQQRGWQGKGNSGSGQWTGLMATAVCTTGKMTATGAQLVARQADYKKAAQSSNLGSLSTPVEALYLSRQI
jgi:hypothetical protein